MAFTTGIVGVVVLVFGLLAAYSSVRVVEEGGTEALVVFGKTKAVLRPGLNFVPPFVSRTYPIDPQTMTMDKGGEQVDVPAEFENVVREAADFRETDCQENGPAGSRSDSIGPNSTGLASTRQRVATLLGRTLFVVGAFGFAIPISMFGHILGSSRWAVSWLFPEATLWEAILATVASLFVMILGESIGRQYGTWGEE